MKYDRKSRVDVWFPLPADAENVEKNKELGTAFKEDPPSWEGVSPSLLEPLDAGVTEVTVRPDPDLPSRRHLPIQGASVGTVGAVLQETWKSPGVPTCPCPWSPAQPSAKEPPGHICQKGQLRRAEPGTGHLVEESKPTFVVEPQGQCAWGDLLLVVGDPPQACTLPSPCMQTYARPHEKPTGGPQI